MSRESEGVSRSLAELETELSRVRAPILAALRPGLTAEAFTALTRGLPFTPSESLAAVYAWHDGSAGGGASEQLFPGGRFAPLARAIEQYELEVTLADWFQPDWFPLFYDEGGTPQVVTEGGAGVVLNLDRSGPDATVQEAASLVDLFAQLVARYRAGAYLSVGVALVEEPGVLARIRRKLQGGGPDVQRLVAEIRDPATRGRATEEIVRHRYPELVEPLISLLSSPDPALRREAALDLGAIGDRRAVPHLVRALAEWEGKDLASAWGGLQPIGEEGAIGHLEAALRDEDPGLRVLAARALGNSEDATAVPSLQAARHDADPRVQAAAEAALRRLGAA